jgi:hypothetical protein
MRASLRRHAGAALGSLAVALVVAAAVAGAGWGIQRVGLRTPPRGELIAAKAVGVLLHYRYVESDVRVVGGNARHAACLQGWQPRGKGRPGGRGARVLYDDGETLLLGDRRVRRLTRGADPAQLRPLLEVELAGCSRPLSDRLSQKLVDGTRPSAVKSSWRGRRAYQVHVRFGPSRFDLYVDRQTLRPLGVRVEEKGVVGWSALRQIVLTTEKQTEFLERFNGG